MSALSNFVVEFGAVRVAVLAAVTTTAIGAALITALLLSDGSEEPNAPWLEVSPAALATSDTVRGVRYVPYNGVPSADQAALSADGSVERPAAELLLPSLSDVLETGWDDDTFVYGSDGSEGNLLPIDNGVVPSSEPRFQTDWQLILPSAKIKASVVRVGLTWDGAMGSPDNPFVVGWYSGSAAIGQPGNALLAGHRDYEDRSGQIGLGVCWELDRTNLGDPLVMHDTAADRYYVYEVVDAAEIRPDSDNAVRYLSQTREPVVTLLTCSGTFDEDTHTYDRRLVIVALLRAVAGPDA